MKRERITRDEAARIIMHRNRGYVLVQWAGNLWTADEAEELISLIDGAAEQGADEEFDPLDVEIFRSDRGGSIVRVLLTCGGPHVEAEYDSRRETLRISAGWGTAYIEAVVSEAPLCNWCQSIVEC